MANHTDKQACKAERRHMPAHVFVTYDAMRASIDEKHIYYGGAYTLANLNNRNVESERTSLKWLEAEGWIVLQNADGRRRFHGKMDTDRWLVLWHDEWLAAQPGRACPPDKYVPAGDRDWKLAKPGEAKPGLWLRNLKAAAAKAQLNLAAMEPDDAALALALLAVYRQTNTGSPVLATNTDRPVLEESANTGEAVLANTGSPVLANTDRPVQANTGAPVGSLTPSGSAEAQTTNPTIHPETRLDGGQEVFNSSAPSGAGDQEAEAAAQALDEKERKHAERQWQHFMTNLPEEMQGAILRKDYKPQLEKQIDDSAASVVLAGLRLWINERELPIADRKADKWGCWLAEGAPFLKRAVDNWHKQNREARLWAFRKIAPTIPQAFFDSDLSFGKPDRNNCERIMAPTFLFPDFEQQASFEKWEKAVEDIRWRHELWADKDDCEELQELRADMRAQIAKRRAEAAAAKA